MLYILNVYSIYNQLIHNNLRGQDILHVFNVFTISN